MSKLLLLATLSCLVYGCTTGTTTTDVDLTGVWDISMAKRDGKVTKSLDQAEINVIDTARLASNLFTAEDTVTYSLTGNSFIIDTDPPMNLTVRDVLGDTLVLKARLNAHRYDMVFVRNRK
jgi:hypothetical protein